MVVRFPHVLHEGIQPRGVGLSHVEDARVAVRGQATDGVSAKLIERILSKLPEAEARIVRHRLDHLGPTRLSDVEEARQRIAEVARQLASKGEIDVPDELRAAVRSSAPAARFVCQA